MAETYRTIRGDMWDSIAHKQLGSVNYTGALMAANRQILDYYIFPAGIEITLPDSKPEGPEVAPPWKRAGL